MQEFSFSTRVFFGEGALERLRKVENRRVIIVTDHFMYTSGVAERVASYLTNCQVTYFYDVVPDPPFEVVAAGVSCLHDCQAEVMVAVGGGSAIDAAKAIRSMANTLKALDTEIMECFAIPTTSGTGSEVTEYAVITDAQKGIKYPLASRALRPPTAILDPALVVSAPPGITADSGMDVLTHALEAYVSQNASDFSDALAEKAVSLVFKWLPAAYQNGEDLLAREKMHNASCLAGLAFNSAGLGLCHGMAHAIGAKFHIPHGRANAMVLPHVLRYNANIGYGRGGEYCTTAKKYQHLARLLGLPCSGVPVANSQLVHGVEALNKKMKIPSNMVSAGIPREQCKAELSALVEAAMADVTTASNPRKPTEQEVHKLFTEVFG